MFSKIKAIHKISMMPGRWVAATGIDTGDQGQIVNAAHDYVNKLGLHPEDAWLTALVNWMRGMPWQENKEIIALGILVFLEAYEGRIALSSTVILNAREHAFKILSSSDSIAASPTGNTIIIQEKKQENGRHEGKPLAGLAKELYEATPSLNSSQSKKSVEISPSPSNKQPRKQESNNTPAHSAPADFADRLYKDDIYNLAVSHVAYQLRLKGFEIIHCGGSRADEVSLKANHEGQNIYILVAAALHPQKPSSPRFMVDRLVSTATTDGADYYICQVAIKVSEGTDLNKIKNGTKDGVNYEFSGLLKPI